MVRVALGPVLVRLGDVYGSPVNLASRLTALAVEAWLPVALVTTWWFASAGSTSIYFPPLSVVMERFYELWLSGPPTSLVLTENVFTDIVPSLIRVLGGWARGRGTVLPAQRNR